MHEKNIGGFHFKVFGAEAEGYVMVLTTQISHRIYEKIFGIHIVLKIMVPMWIRPSRIRRHETKIPNGFLA